jgi:hypothetical protein
MAKRPSYNTEEIIQSCTALRHELELAFDSHPERDSKEYQRARYIHALRAFANFLRSAGAPTAYRKRLFRLAIALSDLNEGKMDWLLIPTATGGVNPGVDTSLWCARANAALGVLALMRCGVPRKVAVKSARDPKVLGWLDEFSRGPTKSKIKNTLAHAFFGSGREFIETSRSDKARLRQLAKHFLASANTMHFRKQS